MLFHKLVGITFFIAKKLVLFNSYKFHFIENPVNIALKKEAKVYKMRVIGAQKS